MQITIEWQILLRNWQKRDGVVMEWVLCDDWGSSLKKRQQTRDEIVHSIYFQHRCRYIIVVDQKSANRNGINS